MQKKISFIIVTYNKFFLLKQCLDSLFKYCGSLNLEVIIVDNNSTEKGLDELLANYANIKLIKNNVNNGFGKANNQGIKIAQGEYILFLNNDTIFIEDCITPIINEIKKNNKPIIAGCQLLNKDLTKQITAVSYESFFTLFGEAFFLNKVFPGSKLLNKYYLLKQEINSIIECDFLAGAFLLSRTATIKELNGFDERFFFYSEEEDLCFRNKNNQGLNLFFPQYKIIHIGGGTSGWQDWFSLYHQSISKQKFLMKHNTRVKYWWFLFLFKLGVVNRCLFNLLLGIFGFNKLNIRKAFLLAKKICVFNKEK